MSMRPGTLATHQIVGLSEAAKLMSSSQSVELQRLQAQKCSSITFRNCQVSKQSLRGPFPGIFNFGFSGVDGETLATGRVQNSCVTGSACNSEKIERLMSLGAWD